MKRESWGSRLGFIFAVAGSAVGLANIWRFPYIVGKHGGAAFIVVYLLSLLFIGFPVFVAEVLIGRTTQRNPSGAFQALGKSSLWSGAGKLTILTGFLVSSFYSAVAGWILGYFFEACTGRLTQFTTSAEAAGHYTSLVSNPLWGVGFHLFFMLLCVGVLYLGVRKGIERGNKVMMPILFFLLLLLVLRGLALPQASEGLHFLLTPDWKELTPTAILIALGQAFFTLSLGQGTMVTYGSYLGKKENIVTSCLPAVIMDTLVSILAAVAVFTIVFSAGIEPNAGPGLLFQTLPLVFSQLPGGYLLAFLFFLLVVLAAITSEISAMEPTIAYLIDERKWSRHAAVVGCGLGAFLIGIPSALSTSMLKDVLLFDKTFLDWIEFLASSILIPFGGFAAVVFVGWIWGTGKALTQLKEGAHGMFSQKPWLATYFSFCFKYSAPIFIIAIFAKALGLL